MNARERKQMMLRLLLLLLAAEAFASIMHPENSGYEPSPRLRIRHQKQKKRFFPLQLLDDTLEACALDEARALRVAGNCTSLAQLLVYDGAAAMLRFYEAFRSCH